MKINETGSQENQRIYVDKEKVLSNVAGVRDILLLESVCRSMVAI
jgi:hypothetical protein